MFVTVVVAYVIGAAVSVVGAGMIVQSLCEASRRGVRMQWRFWAPAAMFTPRELALNRRGFALAMVGMAFLLLLIAYLMTG